jgi:hypothetical protein
MKAGLEQLIDRRLEFLRTMKDSNGFTNGTALLLGGHFGHSISMRRPGSPGGFVGGTGALSSRTPRAPFSPTLRRSKARPN